MRKPYVAHISLFIAALAFATTAGAGNLVANADFDLGLTGWLVPPGSTVTIDFSRECCGSITPASVNLTAFGVGDHQPVLQPCRPTPYGAGPYDFGAWLFVNAAVGTSVEAWVQVQFFDQPDCSDAGGPTLVQRTTSALPALFSWTLVSASATPGSGTKAVTISVNILSNGFADPIDDSIDANFDRVFVGDAGTTAVTLQTFSAR